MQWSAWRRPDAVQQSNSTRLIRPSISVARSKMCVYLTALRCEHVCNTASAGKLSHTLMVFTINSHPLVFDFTKLWQWNMKYVHFPVAWTLFIQQDVYLMEQINFNSNQISFSAVLCNRSHCCYVQVQLQTYFTYSIKSIYALFSSSYAHRLH